MQFLKANLLSLISPTHQGLGLREDGLHKATLSRHRERPRTRVRTRCVAKCDISVANNRDLIAMAKVGTRLASWLICFIFIEERLSMLFRCALKNEALVRLVSLPATNFYNG